MRIGWYLLLYGGITGLLGLTGALLDVWSLKAIIFPYKIPYQLVLRPTIPLLTALVGWLILRRSNWLPLVSGMYLGYAIPLIIGCSYLEWLQGQALSLLLGRRILIVEMVKATMDVLWYNYIILLCQFAGIPETLDRRWRVGIGVYLLLWWTVPLLSACLDLYEQWQSVQARPHAIDLLSFSFVRGLHAVLWIMLGWTLIRSKGWLPAVGVAVVGIVALEVAHQILWLAGAVSSGGAGAGWHWWAGVGAPRLAATLVLKVYYGLLVAAPLVLLLLFLSPAFPVRLIHYLRLWRIFRRRRLQEQSW